MKRSPSILMFLLAAVLTATDHAGADSLLLRGSSIVLEDCRVRSISGGEVIFAGPGGMRMQRHVEDVIAIVFDGIEELDRAEQAMLDQDFRRATKWFVLALSKADGDLQEKWIHARLAAAHAAANEYVQAAGHAAAVFALEDHPSWKRLAPVGDVNRATYPAAAEACERLRSARRSVKSRELVRLIDEMFARVSRVRDQAKATWSGGRVDPRRTVSGYAAGELDDLRASLLEPERPPEDAVVLATPETAAADDAGGGDVSRSEAPPEPGPENDSETESIRDALRPDREDIDSLLDGGRYQTVLARCGSQIPDARGDEAAKLLLQRGIALKALGRPREAVVSFTRSAFLHPASPSAPASLLETAIIYRDIYGKPDKAERILRLARQRAEGQGDDIIAGRATEALDRLRGQGSP